MSDEIDDYFDIINSPRPQSNHKPMSKNQRAAQFLPFAALTGYDESIQEVSRTVKEKPSLSSQELAILNEALNYLQETIHLNEKITILYFQPDSKKNGGEIFHYTGPVKSIDQTGQFIQTADNKKIPFSHLISLQIPSLLKILDENKSF